LLAFHACNAYNKCMQYTIRNVPDTLDEALRRTARDRGKSLNEVAIDALARGAGVTGERERQRDLADIAGTWRKDPAFDSALAAQDTIDEEMWQ
jgi:plasmid stability protein